MELYQGMLLAALIFIASLASVELGLSAAIIEITLGVVGGNVLGIQQLEWVREVHGRVWRNSADLHGRGRG